MDSKWKRVSRREPCRICGKPDWCSLSADGKVAICMRNHEGSIRATRNQGFLHRLTDSTNGFVGARSISIPIMTLGSSAVWTECAKRFQQHLPGHRLYTIATALGLGPESLRRLGIGLVPGIDSFSFPMRDAGGEVRGIRLRFSDGHKSSLRGSRDGLFIPDGVIAPSAGVEELAIAEGPTDTAALLDLGFDAIGRPSCSGGLALLVDFVRLHHVRRVVVFADRDAPGRRGADNLASTVVAYAAAVRVLVPPEPFKDIRDWRRAGATASDVRAAIEQARPRQIAVTSRVILERRPGLCTRHQPRY